MSFPPAFRKSASRRTMWSRKCQGRTKKKSGFRLRALDLGDDRDPGAGVKLPNFSAVHLGDPARRSESMPQYCRIVLPFVEAP